ncbi:hypothetical protein WN982_17675 [Paraburkholderia sp. IMGN_8]|uniref:hypothetical protein n=1 Tax=Paraburkholderia sp. IMGN_8 TaxID=3136564 RepID=UPI003101A4B7
MQISDAREILLMQAFRPDPAALDARTTKAVSALCVPEKLKRRERQMPDGRRARLAALQAGQQKNRFVAKANEAVFLRRNGRAA